ncbi:hypothetical protein R3W88_003414 [Solanum pinnatisectum]|uniref:Prolamin-like domain-containing protein n=1 Tax=Solanum pinnatisectum TaxID=50273 RepID=A0AAV9MNY0_9SOLN|nr:hypothetical protein R3W88_003414 [Solanum pinnatisectum]
MSRSSGTLLCVFLLLGICITTTAPEPETENSKELFGTSSILAWRRWWRYHHHHVPSIGWWGHRYPKKPSPPTHLAPSPAPADNAVPSSHMASSSTNAAPSPVDNVVLPPHMTPTTPCIKIDDCLSDLIASIFKRRISLSTQCCKVVSTISDDCFYRGFVHSKRVPFFLSKVKNCCSHHQG